MNYHAYCCPPKCCCAVSKLPIDDEWKWYSLLVMQDNQMKQTKYVKEKVRKPLVPQETVVLVIEKAPKRKKSKKIKKRLDHKEETSNNEKDAQKSFCYDYLKNWKNQLEAKENNICKKQLIEDSEKTECLRNLPTGKRFSAWGENKAQCAHFCADQINYYPFKTILESNNEHAGYVYKSASRMPEYCANMRSRISYPTIYGAKNYQYVQQPLKDNARLSYPSQFKLTTADL